MQSNVIKYLPYTLNLATVVTDIAASPLQAGDETDGANCTLLNQLPDLLSYNPVKSCGCNPSECRVL